MPLIRLLLVALLSIPSLPAALPAQTFDVDADPIRYREGLPDNVVSQLQNAVAEKKTVLPHSQAHGYLPELLKALEIPVSSQTLVFSKTSLQRDRISSRTPRAIYFNDDVYVGWCVDGKHIELSAVDAQLGTVYYTLGQSADEPVQLTREIDNCTLCHASQRNHQGVPGHLVRSVSTMESGFPDMGVFRVVDHATPIAQRWGGWYVTGKYRGHEHMGNRPYRKAVGDGDDVLDLSRFVDTERYLSPHSDLIALLVLEHQAEGHNRIARAAIMTRVALQVETDMNMTLGQTPGTRLDSTTSRIKQACEPLVEYMLFARETPLGGPVEGTSAFAKEFAARGPFDKEGRSLREFDLKFGLFKYPVSYLIYSKAFTKLPLEARQYVLGRIKDILTAPVPAEDSNRLAVGSREAALEILEGTISDFPSSAK